MTNQMTWNQINDQIEKYGYVIKDDTLININYKKTSEKDLINFLLENKKNNLHCSKKINYFLSKLFIYLLKNKKYEDASLISKNINLLEEILLNIMNEINHSFYVDILKFLCENKNISLFETYFKKIYVNENTDKLYIYKDTISKHFERLLTGETESLVIMNLFKEFIFLTNDIIKDFFDFIDSLVKLKEIDINDNYEILEFIDVNDIYKKFMIFSPIVHKTINEYYTESIKIHINTLIDLSENSNLILSEHFDNLFSLIEGMPQKPYIDFFNQDNEGSTLLIIMSRIPIIINNYETIKKIYKVFLNKLNEEPRLLQLIKIKDNKKNTLLHWIGKNENFIYLEGILSLIEENTLSEIINSLNENNKTIFDILIDNNNIQMINRLIDYLPEKYYIEICNKIIDDHEILKSLTHKNKKIQIIYCMCINNYFNVLLEFKKKMTYDIITYQSTLNKIEDLLKNINNIDKLDNPYLIKWLHSLIELDEFYIFKKIIDENFLDTKNINVINYLHQNIISSNETLLHRAIKNKNMPFIDILMNYDVNIMNNNGESILLMILRTEDLDLINIIKNKVKNDNINEILTIHHKILEDNYKLFYGDTFKIILYMYNFFTMIISRLLGK